MTQQELSLDFEGSLDNRGFPVLSSSNRFQPTQMPQASPYSPNPDQIISLRRSRHFPVSESGCMKTLLERKRGERVYAEYCLFMQEDYQNPQQLRQRRKEEREYWSNSQQFDSLSTTKPTKDPAKTF